MSISNKITFHCPGCGKFHEICLASWQWNQDINSPTISPSVNFNGCQSVIRNGTIQFFDDCNHSLAGKTVELSL